MTVFQKSHIVVRHDGFQFRHLPVDLELVDPVNPMIRKEDS
ncbi:MAG: hypothetical protein OES47_02605 [Acidobacteriota bacterium]|nr:hypothetical protein [Acidobacteriota bacterium]